MEDQNQSEILPEHRARTSSTAEKPTTANDEKSNIEDTLVNINKNLSTMADILQKMYTQRDNWNANSAAILEATDDGRHEGQEAKIRPFFKPHYILFNVMFSSPL